MPKVLKIETIASILGADKAQELVQAAEIQRRTDAARLTEQAITGALRYNTWLTSKGAQPRNYSPETRRHDRLHWFRVVERMFTETGGAQRYFTTYVENVTKNPTQTGKGTYVTCPEPNCGERFLLHGIDIHMSRKHKKRGPNYKK